MSSLSSPALSHIRNLVRPIFDPWLYNLDADERHYFYLRLLLGLLFFPAPGARDSWTSVESRYVEIARFMFLRAEWIVPTIKPFDTLTLISITTVHMRRRKR